jgi:hypothetical protein
MLRGETVLSGASSFCCGTRLPFRVCQSAAGYYIGTWCGNCGPNSRETSYFRTREDAQKVLDNGTWQAFARG